MFVSEVDSTHPAAELYRRLCEAQGDALLPILLDARERGLAVVLLWRPEEGTPAMVVQMTYREARDVLPPDLPGREEMLAPIEAHRVRVLVLHLRRNIVGVVDASLERMERGGTA
jgi:hypothetical protein